MACRDDWGVLLSKHVDGETTPDENQQVETHLSSCAPCRATFDLFRRNEKVLESSLAGEAFGDLVVDEVMAEIRRLETPPVVAPTVEGRGFWEFVRSGRFWPAAAAGVVLLAVTAVLLFAGSEGGFQDTVQALRLQIQELEERHRVEREMLAGQIQQQATELQDAFARMDSGGPDRGTYAYLTPRRSVFVRSTFHDRERFASFSVRRSPDEMRSWTPLATGLVEPQYEDTTAQEAQTYVYQFIGHASDGGATVSAPTRLRVPPSGRQDPEASLKITFFACTVDMRKATFVVERQVGGRVRSEWFTVAPGERIGARVGEVDFWTGLVLDHLEAGDETLGSGAAPGGPIVLTRPNKLARLKAHGAGEPTRDVWRGSSVLVPLPRR